MMLLKILKLCYRVDKSDRHIHELAVDHTVLKLWFCRTVTSSLNSWYPASSDLLSLSGSKNWSTLYCHWSPAGGQLQANDQSSISINKSIIYAGLFQTFLDQHRKVSREHHLATVDAANTTHIKLLLNSTL